jgi:hypothetical protein
VVQEFLAKKRFKLLSHPPYSSDLAPADYVLFPRLKKELAGRGVNREEFASMSGAKSLFASTETMSRNRKKINFLLTITVYFLLTLSGIIWISPC